MEFATCTGNKGDRNSKTMFSVSNELLSLPTQLVRILLLLDINLQIASAITNKLKRLPRNNLQPRQTIKLSPISKYIHSQNLNNW